LKIKIDLFKDEIKLEQVDFIRRINPPSEIAMNLSLRENIYIMYICLCTKIGLFLTGAPG
jgi:hypothetical protein